MNIAIVEHLTSPEFRAWIGVVPNRQYTHLGLEDKLAATFKLEDPSHPDQYLAKLVRLNLYPLVLHK
jgi:hypothetical protein